MVSKKEEEHPGGRLLLMFGQQSYVRSRLPLAGADKSYSLRFGQTGLTEEGLDLVCKKGNWYFGGQGLREDALLTAVTGTGERVSLLLSEEKKTVVPAGRLMLSVEESVQIGKSYQNHIYYDLGGRVLAQHMRIYRHEKGYCIEAYGQGIYVNEERICGSRPLVSGDRIDLYGLHLLLLSEHLICIAFCGVCRIAENDRSLPGTVFSGKGTEVKSREWIERKPEEEGSIHTGELELITPPAPVKKQNNRFFLSLGPSLTMVLPVLLMAVMGNSLMGGSGSGFYYLAVVMTVCSSVLAVFWGTVNHFYRKHMDKTGEANRRKQYREYLEKTSEYLQKCSTDNRKVLSHRYPHMDFFLGMEGESPRVLWNRYYMHRDFLLLRLGTGEQPFQIQIKLSHSQKHIVPEKLLEEANAVASRFAVLKQVPLGMDFYETRILGMIGGNEVYGWMRQVLLQIGACHCYTEIKVVCFYDETLQNHRDFAACARWMPHSWSADKKIRYLAGNEQEVAELLPVFTRELERSQLAGEGKRGVPWYFVFALKEEWIQGELLYPYLTEADGKYPVSTIFTGEEREDLPRCCRSFVMGQGKQGEIVTYGDEAILRYPVELETLGMERSEKYARQISGLRVREELCQGQLPEKVDFLTLYGCTRIEELNCGYRWSRSRTEERLKVPIGCGVGQGLVHLDVHEKFHGPHGLIAGTTGSGKSELLQTYLMSMAVAYSPQDVTFFMIDYKGGGTGNMLKELPHCAGVISNLSGNQIKRAMSAISSENKRRQKLLSDYYVNHVDAYTRMYREGRAACPMPHLILVVDEFAELKKEEPEFMQEIISLAQVGRSLGVHLILATQKPAGTVDDKIWSNARFRLCLRVQDRQDSMDMLHCGDAADLTLPGQCYLQIGNNEYYELFQTAYCGGGYTETPPEKPGAVLLSNTGKRTIKEERDAKALSKLECLVHYISRTARENHFPRAEQLWMPELSDYFTLEKLQNESVQGDVDREEMENMEFLIGMCDDPENQSQFLLGYVPVQQGHLAVCGGPATGKSTFLQTILWQLCMRHDPEKVQFLLIDINRGSLHSYRHMPHCMGLLKNREEKDIFFYHLSHLVKRRKEQLGGISCIHYNRQKEPGLPLVFVVIDGYGGLLQMLNEEQADFMVKLAAEGVNYGIYLLLSATGTGEIPGRLYEKIKNVFALEMSDRFQYGDVLRQYHLLVFPKENVKGRGLCKVAGRILEFQTFLIDEETDDYKRAIKIRETGIEKTQYRKQKGLEDIQSFPSIPEPVSYGALLADFKRQQRKGQLPIGYSAQTAELVTLNIRQRENFLISGKTGSGCRNLMYLIGEGMLGQGERLVCLDVNQSLLEWTEKTGLTMLSTRQEILDWQRAFAGKERSWSGVHFFIGDLAAFCGFLYQEDATARERTLFWETFVLKNQNTGMLLAIYRPERDYCVQGVPFVQAFVTAQRGIHLGGNASAQRVLTFEDLNYSMQSSWEKPGVGYWKNGPGTATKRVLLPEYDRAFITMDDA